jgi:hypothetical protein
MREHTENPPDGLLTIGANVLTRSVANVDVTRGMEGIDRLKILSSVSFVA